MSRGSFIFCLNKGVWKKVLMKDAVNGAAVPIHPGAAKYYKEQGVM